MLIETDATRESASRDLLAGAYFYGAGGRACALAACFSEISLSVGGFVVTDMEKNWKNKERKLLGHPVISIEEFAHAHNDAPLIISSKYEEEMVATCEAYALKKVFLFYQALSLLGMSLSYKKLQPESINENPDALAALDIWADEESRGKYRALLNLHFRPHRKHVPICEPAQYFSPKYLHPDYLANVIDAGAYVGDTLKEFSGITKGDFCSYYAFEPDPESFLSLSESPLVMDSRVRIYRTGLSDRAASVRMQSFGGLGSFISMNGNIDIRTARLSDFFRKNDAVTLIKMDIEGHEEQALAGAEEVIRRNRPALAIAVYHRIEHLWRIPQWIKALDPGYVLRLGHHSIDHDESICYAVPEGRG